MKPGFLESNLLIRMPVSYQIDSARGIIRTRCCGAVTIEEVIGHFQTLERDPQCPDRIDVLLDLSEQITVPTTENLRAVTHEIGRVHGRVQFGNCAVIACTDALFGMLRMLEVFAERYFRQTRVFRTAPEANAWLSAQHPKTSAAG
jgi:hypothetical protein